MNAPASRELLQAASDVCEAHYVAASEWSEGPPTMKETADFANRHWPALNVTINTLRKQLTAQRTPPGEGSLAKRCAAIGCTETIPADDEVCTEHLIELAVLCEREACAKIAETMVCRHKEYAERIRADENIKLDPAVHDGAWRCAEGIAYAIRAPRKGEAADE